MEGNETARQRHYALSPETLRGCKLASVPKKHPDMCWEPNYELTVKLCPLIRAHGRSSVHTLRGGLHMRVMAIKATPTSNSLNEGKHDDI